MQVWRGLLLLSLLAAVCLAQRGPRRFIPDQPLEESLAVDNHRLRSGSRGEAEVATRRGVGRRETVQTEDDPSQTSSRVRGRTGGRQRTFHSRNSEVSSQESSEYPSRESRKLTSRDESQSERIRPRGRDQASGSRARNAASSREETQGQRFTSRDSSEVTQVSPRRTQHAGSSREETSQRFRSRDSAETTADVNTRQRAGSSREDTPNQRYRIRSKTEETPTPARAVNAGRGRSRTEDSADINKSSKRIPSRRVNEEETRPLNPEGSNLRTETRGRSRTLNKDHSLHDQRGSSRSKATSQRIAPKVDSAEDHSTLKHSEAISPPSIEQEKSEPLEEEDADNVPNLENPKVKAAENIPLPDGAEEKLSEPVQASSNSAEETSPSSPIENALEYPSKLNDVEESNRASRRLDSEIPIQSKSSSRLADESENTRQDARKRVQNLEMSLARGRTSETRGREASSEEQYNNRNIETSNTGRRNGLENLKSPRRFTESRNRNTANEYTRNRENTHRNESPTAEESVRSGARAKNQHLKDRQHTSEVTPRRQQQERESVRGNLETSGRTKNYEGRSRTSTLDDNNEEPKAEGKRLTNRGRLQKPSKTENDELSPRRYSARIPDKSVVPEESSSTSSYSKKSKGLSNFRSRAKGKEPTPTAASIESSVEPDESVPLSNQVYEKKEEPAVQPADTTTLKSIDKYLSRKPPTSRGRGTAKGPKLVETDSSSEVSDDDNYPEVYKQLKKSGTSPKDILV